MASLVFVIHSKPYQFNLTDEAHDLIMASTAYGHEAQVVFEGDGIQQLLLQQNPVAGQKHAAKRIAGFPFFDIEPLWVCAASLHDIDTRLDELVEGIRPIEVAEKHQLIEHADFVIRL